MTPLPWRTLSRQAHLRSRTLAVSRQPRRSFSPSPSPVAREALEESSHSHDHGFDVETDPYPLLPPNRPVLRDAARHLPSTHQSMCTATSQSHKMTMQPASAPNTFVRPRRKFHNYFITHLPSSSMHPDRRSMAGSGHLPRDASTPYTPKPGHSPPSIPGPGMANRDMTVVRIPLRSAKHHFGRATARGTRPYNEDSDQAGTIDMPAFAKRAPISLVRNSQRQAEVTPADSSFGDPQIFYFAVFDGHGGGECSEFLRDELHGYIEEASSELGLRSSLGKKHRPGMPSANNGERRDAPKPSSSSEQVKMATAEEVKKEMQGNVPTVDANDVITEPEHKAAVHGADPVPARVRDFKSAIHHLVDLIKEYRDTVGGYFRRFQPEHFNLNDDIPEITVESVLEYAFLRADLDFISAQARKPDPHDLTAGDRPFNNDEILGAPHATPSGQRIGGSMRFKGGSTASVALLSTPTPTPFWHPSAHATLMVAHVGDTRAILCDTSTGLATPVTSDHHPTAPAEARRLRRYAPAASLVTGDSFGEQRIQGLANSRAFGDIESKRIGVSAEPEMTRLDMTPAQFSFLVLCSDGVSGTLSDQEIVDIVKEAKTPDQGARDVVNLATEISTNGDNATCLVVRLGGWERRSEGGLGSLGTKEVRDMRRAEALDPRRGKR